MKRRKDWSNRLVGYLDQVKSELFDYGTNDCALFCAGAVEAMTGVDFAKDFRGYETRDEGIAKMNALGFADHIAFVADKFEECSILEANEGDLVVVEEAALGIVQGRGVYVLTPGGLGLVRLIAANRAFRV